VPIVICSFVRVSGRIFNFWIKKIGKSTRRQLVLLNLNRGSNFNYIRGGNYAETVICERIWLKTLEL
jgi:hypothetical protein